jgi:hypothetical protein
MRMVAGVLSDDIASHFARKLKGKQKVVRIGIQGSKQTCGEALSCGSGVAPSQTVVRTKLRATTVPTMPNLIESPPDYAFWCFPHASPALTFGAGKRPTAEGLFEVTNFLKKNWSGRRDSNPRPQPWQGYISERIWCGRRDSNPHSQRETDFLTTSAFAAASRRSWPGLSLRHGLSAEGAARPVSTPSLNRGLGSGLAWGSSPLAFPDFERFCSTNFPVGTPIGSLLRLPISPRPLCHISAITRFVAR